LYSNAIILLLVSLFMLAIRREMKGETYFYLLYSNKFSCTSLVVSIVSVTFWRQNFDLYDMCSSSNDKFKRIKSRQSGEKFCSSRHKIGLPGWGQELMPKSSPRVILWRQPPISPRHKANSGRRLAQEKALSLSTHTK
jgi:hypothetical protein